MQPGPAQADNPSKVVLRSGAWNRAGPAIQDAEEVSSPTLRSLTERAGRGDVDAFRELFDRYHRRVHRYAWARVGRGDAAQDIAQEVFPAVWRGMPSFRYEHEGSFPGWIFRIARNVVASHLRRAGARARAEDRLGEAPDEALDVEGATLARRVLVDALCRLPEAQREVLVLRFYVGLRLREVAQALGKSESAVTSLQFRSLAALRRVLEEDDGR